MSPGLLQELDRMTERVTDLARVAADLHAENQTLRSAMDERDSENRVLRDRLATARDRVEGLIARIPADS